MFKKVAIAALFAAVSHTAAAEQFYIGADVGATKFQGISGNKTSYGVYGGYQFQENFSAELGLRRMGDLTMYGVDVKTDQAALSLIARLPLSNGFHVYGRLGYNYLDVNASYGGNHGNGNTSGGLYGLGVGYDFTPAVSARIELQRPTSDTTNLSAGVSFKF
ncbi:MAG TPA: outer membrane beta-barrel protein [Telluria sp.]|nr:outer membrane beta-barrel protein [Telluria sp.]